MATKSYSKHKEYKEFSSSSRGSTPQASEQFDMLKAELIPKGSRLESMASGNLGTREYQYEYKEEKLPSGKYDRKDLRTVEEYTIPARSSPKAAESSYFYERQEKQIPIKSAAGSRSYNYESTTSSSPGYSRVKTSKVSKDLSKNVDELDSLLDDLQKDQERQLYRSKLDGYASDTAESYDYKRSTLGKAPSSGYSTLKHEERVEKSSWGAAPPPPATTSLMRQEMYREEKSESRVVPTQIPMPQPAPLAVCSNCHHLASSTMSRSSTPMNKVTTTVKTYTYEVPADQDPASVPLPPLADHERTYVSTAESRSVNNLTGAPLTCQYCSQCNTKIGEVTTRSLLATSDENRSERVLYPAPANAVTPLEPLNQNGHGPYGPSTYKYTETTYSSQNTTERFPPSGSRPHSPPNQTPPKRLDDLMADFPEAKFPTETDGVVKRKVQVTHEKTESKVGPAVYYPPGHTPFAKKDGEGYQASAMQGGGAYASGKGMYEYESGAKSKEKHSEKKTAVPVCLPLCCAMPCVIM